MVRAILDGKKTQTRRIVKPQPDSPRSIYSCPGNDTIVTPHLSLAHTGANSDVRSIVGWEFKMTQLGSVPCKQHDGARFETFCPYGKPGDGLWVKETWKPDPSWGYPPGTKPTKIAEGTNILYRATIPEDHPKTTWQKWRPCLFMRRWMSRITLDVASVRVERLHDISEADAKAEGALYHDGGGIGHSGWRHDLHHGHVYTSARESFFALWKSINGEESLKANPWVWVVEFKKLP